MPEIRVTPGTGVTRISGTRNPGNHEFRVLGFTRRLAILESPGDPGSRSHPERRVHGVTELPGTSGSRSHSKAQVPEVTLAESPGRESPETPGSRSTPQVCVPGVTRNSVFTMLPGTPGSGTPRYRVIPETRSSG